MSVEINVVVQASEIAISTIQKQSVNVRWLPQELETELAPMVACRNSKLTRKEASQLKLIIHA